jgi:hypothetical protein
VTAAFGKGAVDWSRLKGPIDLSAPPRSHGHTRHSLQRPRSSKTCKQMLTRIWFNSFIYSTIEAQLNQSSYFYPVVSSNEALFRGFLLSGGIVALSCLGGEIQDGFRMDFVRLA